MKSIIVGTETFTEPTEAEQKMAEIFNISVENAEWYIIAQLDASDSFIDTIEALEWQGFKISDNVYIKAYLRADAKEDIIFKETAGLTPVDSFTDLI